MPFPVSKRKKFKISQLKEINLIPVLNIFLIMIPFLMYSVVLSRLVSLNLRLPEYKEKDTTLVKEEKKDIPKIIPLILKIQSDSLIFTYDGKIIKELPYITLKNDSIFISILENMKKNYEPNQPLILKPDDLINYEDIITLLDRGRYSGFKKISLSY